LVLDIGGLSLDIAAADGTVAPILRDVDLAVPRGSVMGLVGESGSGKTMTMRALLALTPAGARTSWERLAVAGVERPPGLGRRARVRWPVAMVFQDPMTSLNPLRKVGFHLTEVIGRFQPVPGRQARELAVETLRQVGIDQPARRFGQYPHELSGGMRQRAMIAMALLAKPALLIADEPTTALDVTVQAQILDLIHQVRLSEGLSVVLVTHDLGVVAEMCDAVAVMRSGRIVEEGLVDEVFYDPRHPHTVELLAAMPGKGLDGSGGTGGIGGIGGLAVGEAPGEGTGYSWVTPTHRVIGAGARP
jgi:ABC-type dipeptide/oligopeptide/nickel transport system ATPase component